MRGLRNLEYERAGKIWKAIVPEKHFKHVLCKMSGFKLNFESQFDILCSILLQFQLILVL